MGNKVREYRKKLGWSQQVLADYSNLEKNQIRRVEFAKNSASIAIIATIAKALGRQPYELLKTETVLKVNKDLESPTKLRRVITGYIRDLSKTSFFNQPRSVNQIVEYCEEKYDVKIPSSAASGVLKKLVEDKILKRIPAKIKGRFSYQRK